MGKNFKSQNLKGHHTCMCGLHFTNLQHGQFYIHSKIFYSVIS